MIKTLIASSAALLVAGTAAAAEIDVVVDPDAEGEVIVRHVPWTPAMDAGLADAGQDRGMLTADELVEGRDAKAIFGFDPDAVIYIDEDEAESGIHTFVIE